MEENLLNEFKQHSVFRLTEGQRMIHLALAKVGEESLWKLPSSNGLSLGNQLLHICGNMTQYAVSSLGEIRDDRKRELELSTRGGYTKTELLHQLDQTIALAKSCITEAPLEHYLKIRRVQGFEFSGVGVVLHAVEHFSYHVGQMAFWIKQLTQEDLGFYDQHDLTQLNP